jgi:hypothetical protein
MNRFVALLLAALPRARTFLWGCRARSEAVNVPAWPSDNRDVLLPRVERDSWPPRQLAIEARCSASVRFRGKPR